MHLRVKEITTLMFDKISSVFPPRSLMAIPFAMAALRACIKTLLIENTMKGKKIRILKEYKVPLTKAMMTPPIKEKIEK